MMDGHLTVQLLVAGQAVPDSIDIIDPADFVDHMTRQALVRTIRSSLVRGYAVTDTEFTACLTNGAITVNITCRSRDRTYPCTALVISSACLGVIDRAETRFEGLAIAKMMAVQV